MFEKAREKWGKLVLIIPVYGGSFPYSYKVPALALAALEARASVHGTWKREQKYENMR